MGVDVKKLVDQVIGVEGGYADHPADRGGPTMWGITQQVARAHGYMGDMRKLTREFAAAIYVQRYWTEPGFDRVAAVAPAIAAELFDIAVNMGPRWSGLFLQRALNVLNRGGQDYPDIPADGRIGTMTIDALGRFIARRQAPGLIVLLKAISCLRGARYIDIAEHNPSQEAFAYGWIANRVGQEVGQEHGVSVLS